MAGGPSFRLGGLLGPVDAKRTGEALDHPASALTTHGVIVGMTGSGKTGLGIVLLEEALLSGIPTLILDPKGDMGNLLFQSPEARPADFRGWIDEEEAKRSGSTADAYAASMAQRWGTGLDDWEVGKDRRRAMVESVRPVVYTPGSSAGVPLDLVGRLAAPSVDWSEAEESVRDEIEAFVSSLLTLAGRPSDPLTSPEHILLANLIEHAWRQGADLDLARLVAMLPEPPIRTLGVFDVDTFIPRKDRMALALRLNSLLASPTFRSWMDGPALQPEVLFASPDGRTPAPIIYLAHLSDEERQFVVTLLLSRMVRWIRQQPGTSELKALIYLDEVFGYAPPTAQPPAKKPIMTIFKQARAHGVGMVVATQNPVDLDYKIMSNAGTWMVGRLQTERDKLRIIEAISSASGGVDTAMWDRRIGELGKRQFLFHTSRSTEPRLFTTRWAISYLRGPLTLAEIERLDQEAPVLDDTDGDAIEGEGTGVSGASTEAASAQGGDPGVVQPVAASGTPPTAAVPAVGEAGVTTLPVQPEVAAGTPVRFLDPAAPWGRDVGATAQPTRWTPALVARVRLLFDERAADLDHTEEWEAVFHPLGRRFDPTEARVADYDDRDLRTEPWTAAPFELPVPPVDSASFFRDARTDLKEHLYRERRIELLRNAELKLFSRVGEDRTSFSARCTEAAEAEADAEIAKLRDRYEKRLATARERLAKEEERLRELEVDVDSRKRQEWISGAGALLNMFLSGKARSSTLSGAASRRSMTRRTEERRRTAEDRLERQAESIEELDAELAEEITAIHERWQDAASAITEFEVPLEKTDIDVDELALVWIPTA